MKFRAVLAVVGAFGSVAIPPLVRSAGAGVGIEVYREGDDRPAELTPILHKLEGFTIKRGAVVTGERQWLILNRLPGVQDRAITPKKIRAKLDDADRKAFSTDFDMAAQYLATALDWIARNPGVAIQIPTLDELLTRAYVTLALMASDAGDKKAAIEWMIRVMATIPSHPAIRTKFGGDAEALYNQAAKVAQKRERGVLTVRVTNPRARIFIDEIERGAGGRFGGALPERETPYRVYVEVDGTGYRFDRHIVAGGDHTLDVDWDFHRSFVATRDWIGLMIPAELKHRQTEFLDRAAIMISSSRYYVLGLRKTARHRYLTGQVYMRQLGYECAGEIVLDDEQEDARMEAFAAFLETCTFSPLVTFGIGTSEQAPAPIQRHSDPSPLTVTSLVVGGAALLTLGAYFVGEDAQDRNTCPDFPCKGTAIGIPAAAVGLGTLILALWWAGREPPRRNDTAPSVMVVPTSAGAMGSVGWKF